MATENEVICNCAAVSPTMPTYRTEHLRSCPVAIWEAIEGLRVELREGRKMDRKRAEAKVKADARGVARAAQLRDEAARV